MKRVSILVLAFGASTLVACDGLKEALTAHVDVVARAGSQELSVTRLSDMLGNAKLQVPVNKEVATLVARDLWVPYQLLATAAARGDSLTDAKAIDAATTEMVEQLKLRRLIQGVSAKLPVDAGGQPQYESATGGMYAARHILFMLPENAPQAARDSVKRVADQVRGQITTANFADLAKKHSQDPQSAARGGDLGLFPRADMVKPFGDAVAALKPGEISPLVQSQFGYHIIQRSTWDQVKDQYAQQAGMRGRQVAESTFIAKVEASSKVEVKADAAEKAKLIAKAPMDHRNDKDVIATYNGGQLTTGKLARVLLADQRLAQIQGQIQSLPDSLVRQFVKNIAQQSVLVKQADSAKVGLTAEETTSLRREFGQAVAMSWQALGIDPKSLADSAKTQADRERLAAARVEAYLDKVVNGEAQPLPVPPPLQMILLDKFDAKVNTAGIDRAVERAQKVRVVADSTRAANMPRSDVPLPGAPRGGAPQGQAQGQPQDHQHAPGAPHGAAPQAAPQAAPNQPAPTPRAPARP